MEKLKVLIIDDSVVYRTQIRAALQLIPWVEVVGAASNGSLGLQRLSQTQPDLLILDLEMPELDGLQTLKRLGAEKSGCKVLVFSSLSERGARITMDALKEGASDFITKPSGADDFSGRSSVSPTEKIKSLLLPKITALFPQYLGVHHKPAPREESARYPKILWDLLKPDILVIGSSTGGPTVLERIFAEMPSPIRCPIVIAQHMPPIFTATFAERLSKVSGLSASEAKNGEQLQNNWIYVVPGDYHLRLHGTAERAVIALDQGPQINSVRPAVDPLFMTAAQIFKQKCLGFVLTGMGSDGRAGAEAIKEAGGAVVIQSEESCVVFGMPGAVHAAGAYDRIANPRELVEIMSDKLTVKPMSPRMGAVSGG